ncbi:hypothetical protein TI04_01945 [Achromatium sp. WMS2]|nr:hypothetical protein TI04_01945 [Achromatium sp. WMS2]
MQYKFIQAFFKAIPISVIIFYGIWWQLNNLSNVPSDQTAIGAPFSTVEQVTAQLESDIALLKCLNSGDISKMSIEDCDPKPMPSAAIPVTAGQVSIYAIYVIQWLCLNIQIALFILAFNKNHRLSEAYGHLANWAVNAGPMLGVLGTILSFALLLTNAGAEGLAAIFNSYFFSAAITTLMGGMVYIITLLLMYKIGPAIDYR